MQSLWQQAGRAGRGTRPSVAIFIALDSPLDQELVANPASLLRREMEAAIVDPYNLWIVKDHLLAAAHELPLNQKEGQLDTQLFGKLALTEQVAELVEAGELVEREGGVGYWSKATPAKRTSIRNMDSVSYKVIDLKRESPHDDGVLETMEYSMAMLKLYEGAVYMHEGRTFVVQQCDTTKHFAKVQRNDVSYYTEPRDHTRVTILGRTAAREASTAFTLNPAAAGAAAAARCPQAERAPAECIVVMEGRVRVKKEIYGYRKKRSSDSQVIDRIDVHMPPLVFDTLAMWVSIPPVIRDEVSGAGWAMERGGLHAIEHLLITLCPLLVHTEPNDLKCQCTRRAGDGCADYIMLFEANKGGIGLAGRIAETIEQLLSAALRRVSRCPCLAGCPSCIHLPNCGDYNEGLEKAAAIYILCRLLGQPCNALPTAAATNAPSGGGSAPAAWDAGVELPHDGELDDRAPPSAGRCVICLSRFSTPVATACGHVFCFGCVKHHIQQSNAAATATAGGADGTAAGAGAAAAAGGARAVAEQSRAYAGGARCPVCRMPTAMSDLRPAEFEEDGTATGSGGSADPNADSIAAAAGKEEEEEEVDEWAQAEAAWAAAEAEADAAG